jgi:hypothetical protein
MAVTPSIEHPFDTQMPHPETGHSAGDAALGAKPVDMTDGAGDIVSARHL